MTSPTPDKLSVLMSEVQSHWRQPERHLVESAPLSVVRAVWIDSRNMMLGLQNDYVDARRAVASMEERLPIARDITFWTRDPAAGLPLPLFADALNVTTEELIRELFSGVSHELCAIISNTQPLRCPLCNRRK